MEDGKFAASLADADANAILREARHGAVVRHRGDGRARDAVPETQGAIFARRGEMAPILRKRQRADALGVAAKFEDRFEAAVAAPDGDAAGKIAARDPFGTRGERDG